METLFAVRMEYGVEMYYHQVIASKASPPSEAGRASDEKQARALLESSCLEGMYCNAVFREGSFEVENPEIITEYDYDGITGVQETSRYFVIFWNRSIMISIEKAGFYRGHMEEFAAFLWKKCGKKWQRSLQEHEN
ncbi:MAG: YcxB family protein [Lachnospiraceae bacterium]|jgi:hypothetical protein|nr:YcxB family protein [Lachnospiraceae bacterium]